MPRDVDEFLGQVRRAYTPDLEAKARVRRSLAAAALLSSATVVSQTAAAKALGAKAGALGLGLTLAGVASVAVLVGAFSLAQWVPQWGGSPVRLREPELPKVAQTVAVRSAVSMQEHELPSPIAFEIPVVERTAEMHPAGHGTGTAVATSKEPPSRELLEELRLIRMATQSLRDGQTSAASQALNEHHSRYPSGKLATERRGLHVLLQCAAGKTPGARSAAEAFLKSSPSSPLSGRVRRDCFE